MQVLALYSHSSESKLFFQFCSLGASLVSLLALLSRLGVLRVTLPSVCKQVLLAEFTPHMLLHSPFPPTVAEAQVVLVEVSPGKFTSKLGIFFTCNNLEFAFSLFFFLLGYVLQEFLIRVYIPLPLKWGNLCLCLVISISTRIIGSFCDLEG